jgi:hypothetical protein
MTEQSEWPKHPDGSNKRVGDMTPEERRAVFKAAGIRLKAELERPEVQERVAHVLNGGTTQ